MENEINMNEKAKVLVFLDTEDLMRIRGTVDYDAVFARIAKNGDLELLRDDAQTVNGYAVCGEERNASLKALSLLAKMFKSMSSAKRRESLFLLMQRQKKVCWIFAS